MYIPSLMDSHPLSFKRGHVSFTVKYWPGALVNNPSQMPQESVEYVV